MNLQSADPILDGKGCPRHDLIWDDLKVPNMGIENECGPQIMKEEHNKASELSKNAKISSISIEQIAPYGVIENKKKSGRKTNFTEEDNQQLSKFVEIYGDSNWSFIASLMKKWNRKQLRDHYINFIKGKSTASNFTKAEDTIIIQYVKKFGNKWKDIADKLHGRTPIAIKNRYYKCLMKRSNVIRKLSTKPKCNSNYSQKILKKSNERQQSTSRPGDSRLKFEDPQEEIDNLSRTKTDLNGYMISLDSEVESKSVNGKEIQRKKSIKFK